jgi:ribosome biogenesis protein ERB1
MPRSAGTPAAKRTRGPAAAPASAKAAAKTPSKTATPSSRRRGSTGTKHGAAAAAPIDFPAFDESDSDDDDGAADDDGDDDDDDDDEGSDDDDLGDFDDDESDDGGDESVSDQHSSAVPSVDAGSDSDEPEPDSDDASGDIEDDDEDDSSSVDEDDIDSDNVASLSSEEDEASPVLKPRGVRATEKKNAAAASAAAAAPSSSSSKASKQRAGSKKNKSNKAGSGADADADADADANANGDGDGAAATATGENADENNAAAGDGPPINPETGFPVDPTVLRGYVGKKPLYEGGVARDEDSESEQDVDGFTRNTVGNIPMEWYDDEDHIGYDLEGNRITRKQRRDELDELIRKIDDPDYWRTVRDDKNDRDVRLSDRELDILRRIQQGHFPDPEFDPNPEYTDWFQYDGGDMPLTARPEPKSRFVPSRWEHKKIMKIVRSIRAGRIVLDKPKPAAPPTYMLWDDENTTLTKHQQQLMSLPAPKMTLPGHAASYNPPEEYLMTPEEIEAWKAAEPEDRALDFIPHKYANLRSVPMYTNSLPERFERCLDLYMAPRTRKLRIDIDPASLIPKLPKPRDLAPFPSTQCMCLTGHRGRVRAVSISPQGHRQTDAGSVSSSTAAVAAGYLASGGDDGVVRVWELRSGRCVYTLRVGFGDVAAAPLDLGGRKAEEARAEAGSDHEDLYDGAAPEGDETMRTRAPIDALEWSPNAEHHVLAVAAGDYLYLITPTKGATADQEDANEALFAKRDAAATGVDMAALESHVKWQEPAAASKDRAAGLRCLIKLRKRVRSIAWHGKGDYLSTVSPAANTTAVAVHQISKRHTQFPFRKLKGQAQCVSFHPIRPIFFVATQRYIRVYDLAEQKLQKRLLAGTKWITSMAVHRGGDNLIVGGLDRRVCWFDMDLSQTAYKQLRYHREAVRDVAFHPRLPLFASASDDGACHIYHGMVYDDLLSNPLIVPLKVLRGHKVTGNLGPMSICFHPTQPWLISSGADSTIRIWTNIN